MTSTAAAGSTPGRRAPRLLVGAATIVALLAVVPIAYLVVRALSADDSARALAPLSTTIELAWSTTLLAFGVVLAALLVGVPFAWLVVRTDLPGRRVWGLAATLPLVIPSFVAALAMQVRWTTANSLPGPLPPIMTNFKACAALPSQALGRLPPWRMGRAGPALRA